MPLPQRPMDFDLPFLDAGEYVESPSELQPSLTTDWLHVTSYDDLLPSTPCLQDLMQDPFEVYGGDRVVEASSNVQPYKDLLALEECPSSETQNSLVVQLHGMSSSLGGQGVAQTRPQRASIMCPSPSSPFLDLREATRPPIPVMVEEGPNSLFFTQDLGSPMPGETSPSSRSTTPDTLLDFPVYTHDDFESILNVNHNMHTPEVTSVKAKLKNVIRKKRKSQGLDELCPDTKEPRTNEMTAADNLRYEKRKASNRKAATKLRQRKKVETATLQKEMKTLEEENEQLRAEVEGSKEEIARLQKVVADHQRGCGWDPDHQWA